MLFGRMRVSSVHNDLRVGEHRGERHEVNARLRRTSRPSVAQIVKSEPSHAATLHSGVMCRVHFDDRFTFDTTRLIGLKMDKTAILARAAAA